MGLYRAFNPRFWTDPKIENKLDKDERYLYLYLITNPNANLCGCYEISLRRIAYETALDSAEIVLKLIRKLEAKKFIKFSEQTHEILMLHWASNNWTSSDKLDKPIFNELQKISDKEFQKYIYDIFKQRKSVKNLLYTTYRIDTVSIQEQSKDTVSVSVINTVNLDSDRDCKEKEEDLIEVRFESFWKSYPRKEGKGKCLDWFKRNKPSQKLLEQILNAIAYQKNTDKWTKDKGQFIPMPFTWLNQRRWEDEVRDDCSVLNLAASTTEVINDDDLAKDIELLDF